MRKYLTLLVLFTLLVVKAQCPTPSNIIVTNPYPFAAELSWTENGTATAWEVAFVPDYVIGSPPPTTGWVFVASNPLLLTNLPQGCIVFYIRSVCSGGGVSDWVLAASWECGANVYVYIASLNTNDFNVNLESKELKIYPNPTTDFVSFDNSNSQFTTVKIYNCLGQVVGNQILTPSSEEGVDVGALTAGVYLLQFEVAERTVSVKIVKE